MSRLTEIDLGHIIREFLQGTHLGKDFVGDLVDRADEPRERRVERADQQVDGGDRDGERRCDVVDIRRGGFVLVQMKPAVPHQV